MYGNAVVMYSPLTDLSESIRHMPKTAKEMVRYERKLNACLRAKPNI